MNRRLMPIFMLLSTLTLLTAMVGCGKKDGGTGETKIIIKTDGVADLANAKPDVTMTVADWFAEFKADKQKAATKYAGKVIELTGEVSTIAQNFDERITFVHLKVAKDLLGVRCGFRDFFIWEKLVPGSQVVVRGKVPDDSFFAGELMPVHLVSVEKKSAETAKTTELIEEFLADDKKFKEKWADKWVYLEGALLRVNTGKDGISIVLKGSGKVDIDCAIPADAKKAAQAMPIGRPVKVFGKLYVVDEPFLSFTMFRGL